MPESVLMLYKVSPPDDDRLPYVTESLDEAMELAGEWGAPNVQCWAGGNCIATYKLDGEEGHRLIPDISELTRKLTVRMSIEQIAWLTQLELVSGMNKSQLTRLGLTLLAAFMNQPPIPAILPQGNPNQTPLPDSPLETRLHAMVWIACENTFPVTNRLVSLSVIQSELKAGND